MKNAIVITNVDSLLGYALAYRFLEDWNREERGYNKLRATTEFRLLCHERQGLEDLERLGGKVFEMKNFNNEKAMASIMRNVYYVMFVPEFSEQRMEEGHAVMKAAKNENVDYLAMFSYVGLDHLDNDATDNKMKNLKQFRELEQQVPRYFNKDSYCIIRGTIWNQFFYYFGPMIEDENKITLPVHKKSKWTTIDLADLVDAVYNLSNDYDEQGKPEVFNSLGQMYISNLKKKNKTMFELTGRHHITAEQLVEAACEGLEREDMTYERIESAKMYDYLCRIHNDNRFRERPNQQATNICTVLDKQGQDLAADRPYTFPLGMYLNENLIKTSIEYWELIDAGKADKTTDDLEKALDRKPQDIYHFFKRNKDQFRRLR